MIPEYPQWALVMGQAASYVVAGTKTPEKALNDANQEIYEMMNRSKYYE